MNKNNPPRPNCDSPSMATQRGHDRAPRRNPSHHSLMPWQGALVASLIALLVAATALPPLNRILDVAVEPARTGTDLVLRFEREPAYTVFRLANPNRLVLELAEADITPADRPHATDGTLVASIAALQVSDGQANVGRLIVAFDEGATFRVTREKNALRVSFIGGESAPEGTPPAQQNIRVAAAAPAVAMQPAVAMPAPATPAPAAPVEEVVASERVARLDTTAQSVPREPVEPDPEQLAKAMAEGPVKVMGVTIKGKDKADIAIDTAGRRAYFLTFRLDNPSRLVVDVLNGKRGFTKTALDNLRHPMIRSARYGIHDKHLRFVFEMTDDADFTVNATESKRGIAVTLAPGAEAAEPAYARVEADGKSRELVEVAAPFDTGATDPTPAAPALANTASTASSSSIATNEEAETTIVESPAIDTRDPAPEPAPAIAARAPVADPVIDTTRAEGDTNDRTPEVSYGSPAKQYEVTELRFDEDEITSKITIRFAGPLPQYRLLKRSDRTKILELFNTRIPQSLVRSLDTSAFAGPVAMVSSFPYPKDTTRTRVVVNLRGDAEQALRGENGELVWSLRGVRQSGGGLVAGSSVTGAVGSPDEGRILLGPTTAQETVAPADDDNDSGEEGAILGEESDEKSRYRGKRISLDFKDADIRNILRLIADVSRLNIIASDDVKGNITVTLRNVPWDEALDIILQSKGLGKEQRGNILRVAPLEVLQREAELNLAKQKAQQEAEPLKVRLVPVNYALAGDLAPQVRDVLSDRGSVTVDTRTNVLVVKDVVENLVKAETLVRNLDTQTPQVLIESRIVEANSQFQQAFGIQWGGNIVASPGTGNATGLSFPNTVGVFGGADDPRTNTQLSGTSNPGRFAVNLPVPVGAGSGGALGFTFGSAGNDAVLNLRLSALESTGSIKVVSSPKVTTLDNKTAKINQGVSIPISVVSAAGVQTTFVNAALELNVTPHVTADGSVLMKLKLTNNQPDFSRTGAAGDPTILKQEAETEMLVRDGDTAVIGGIYVRRTTSGQDGVPLLGRIPVIGFLFRRSNERDERAELLIFVTPRIVNRAQSFTQVE